MLTWRPPLSRRRPSQSASLTEAALSKVPAAASGAQQAAQLKPLTDVLAGAIARAASQSTIHPLDTIKVRMQAAGRPEKTPLSKIGQLMPPPGAPAPLDSFKSAGAQLASLYKGVLGAASGAGVAIGAYFAFYSAAYNLLRNKTDMTNSQIAFVSGGAAAAGSSVIKVPIAVCIRNVQAGNFRNAVEAFQGLVREHGVRGLFRGYVPTVLEDVPDMAFKFACYETLRQVHRQLVGGRNATPQEDFVMGAAAGSFAAAATTPLDVIKTRMAVSPISMADAAKLTWSEGGVRPFFRGVGPRALSNGINSAVFFVFFECLSREFRKMSAQRALERKLAAEAAGTELQQAMA